MTRLQKYPRRRYFGFIVKPIGEFNPDWWGDKPKNYRILEPAGEFRLESKKDFWRFRQNSTALQDGSARHRWAIAIG